jgi:prolipoprotein diacylglyceryltransferase
MSKQIEETLEKVDKETHTLEIVTKETRISKVIRKVTARVIPTQSFDPELLQGKTLQVYWYLLEHGAASVRDVHKALDFSSPGLVYYQMKKLLAGGIIAKDVHTDKYFIREKVKSGILDFYIEIGSIFIPRFSIYLTVFLLGFVLFFLSALLWGDAFMTNPGTILLFFFLLFGSFVFIYESMRTWKLKPN